eukprot:639985-Hanusia_phi.AAC.2
MARPPGPAGPGPTVPGDRHDKVRSDHNFLSLGKPWPKRRRLGIDKKNSGDGAPGPAINSNPGAPGPAQPQCLAARTVQKEIKKEIKPASYNTTRRLLRFDLNRIPIIVTVLRYCRAECIVPAYGTVY